MTFNQNKLITLIVCYCKTFYASLFGLNQAISVYAEITSEIIPKKI